MFYIRKGSKISDINPTIEMVNTTRLAKATENLFISNVTTNH